MQDISEIIPHLPPWYGFVVIKEWAEIVKSGTSIGSRHMISFINKKGNEQTMTKRVVWGKL